MNEPNDRQICDEVLGAGRYRVRKLVAQSASGTVYDALDSRTGNVVEITVRPANEDDLQRVVFAQSNVLLRLRIEGIAQVFDIGVDDGQYFEVRARLDGPTLCTLLNTSRLSCRESATLIANVARIAHAAHLQGILLGPVTPRTIHLTGRVTPTLAWVPHRLEESPLGTDIGSLAYMSPEQLQNVHHMGPRSDIYTLGVILYESLVGELPIHRERTGFARLIRGNQPSGPRSVETLTDLSDLTRSWQLRIGRHGVTETFDRQSRNRNRCQSAP